MRENVFKHCYYTKTYRHVCFDYLKGFYPNSQVNYNKKLI